LVHFFLGKFYFLFFCLEKAYLLFHIS
jgi:hypothetical protein